MVLAAPGLLAGLVVGDDGVFDLLQVESLVLEELGVLGHQHQLLDDPGDGVQGDPSQRIRVSGGGQVPAARRLSCKRSRSASMKAVLSGLSRGACGCPTREIFPDLENPLDEAHQHRAQGDLVQGPDRKPGEFEDEERATGGPFQDPENP